MIVFHYNKVKHTHRSALIWAYRLHQFQRVELLIHSGISNQEDLICDHYYTYIHTVIHFMITFLYLSVIIVY